MDSEKSSGVCQDGAWPITSLPNIFLAGNYPWYCSECSSFVCLVCFVYVVFGFGFFWVCILNIFWSLFCVLSVVCYVLCVMCAVYVILWCVMFCVSCSFCTVCVCVPVRTHLGPLRVLVGICFSLGKIPSENLHLKRQRNQNQISHLIRNGPSPACRLKRYLPVWRWSCAPWTDDPMTGWTNALVKHGLTAGSGSLSCCHSCLWFSQSHLTGRCFQEKTNLSSDVRIKVATWPRLG